MFQQPNPKELPENIQKNSKVKLAQENKILRGSIPI